MRAIDDTGNKYYRLTVIKKTEIRVHNHATWLCRCDCGNYITLRANHFRSGNTKSCGCLNDERRLVGQQTHGESKTKEYGSWNAMIGRCYRPSNYGYEYYSSIGITVCDRWRKSYKNFLQDMGRAPSPKHSIDRIDNFKGYSPDNCRWATAKEQSNNTRKKQLQRIKSNV